jgi:hypothetical protein
VFSKGNVLHEFRLASVDDVERGSWRTWGRPYQVGASGV